MIVDINTNNHSSTTIIDKYHHHHPFPHHFIIAMIFPEQKNCYCWFIPCFFDIIKIIKSFHHRPGVTSVLASEKLMMFKPEVSTWTTSLDHDRIPKKGHPNGGMALIG